MVLYYVLGGVVLIAVLVVGLLFYLLSKEAKVSVIPTASMVSPQESPKVASVVSQPDHEFKARIDDLEQELKMMSEKSLTQAQESMRMIDALTRENQALKLQKDNIVQEQNNDLVKLQENIEHVQQDNNLLKNQFESSQARVSQLQDELVNIRKQAAEDIAQAKAVIEQFKSEREVLASRAETINQITQSTQEQARQLQDVMTQNEILLQQTQELKAQIDKHQVLNNELVQKEQQLQYELTKQRAQASGLEKICANYKMQLEGNVCV